MVASILYIAVSNNGGQHEIHITHLIAASVASIAFLLIGMAQLLFAKSLQSAAWRKYENSPTWLRRLYSPVRLDYMKSPRSVRVRRIIGLMAIVGAILLMLLVLFEKTG
jgi:hypothetical protein